MSMLNRAYIDLQTLRNNAVVIKSKLPTTVKFCAVVKADGYGHGAIPVANALYNLVDCFAVALVEEGIALRRGGIDKDILLLIPPLEEDVFSTVFYRLTLAVDSPTQVLAIERECARQKKRVSVHIKFNSGMNRLGVDTLCELKKLLECVKGCEWVELGGAFSHFSFPENKKAFKSAQNKFLLANNLVKSYNDKAICHISSSGGFLKGGYFDMVRIGILLYGYKPFNCEGIRVNPIMKIYSPIIKKRRLKAGESALYGDKRTYRSLELDLVRCGYADGFFRKNDGEIFSRRCMDLSLYLKADSQNGWALVMGDADKQAKKNDTISYEVLTKSALRAEKIYLN